MVVPNNHGFPTKNDHFEVFWGYHHLRKHPYGEHAKMNSFHLGEAFRYTQKSTILQLYENWDSWTANSDFFGVETVYIEKPIRMMVMYYY